MGLAILVAGGLGYLWYGMPSVRPAADIAIERTPERIERGRYLVENVMGWSYYQKLVTQVSGGAFG